MEEKTQDSSSVIGLVFVGCLLVGIGLGILYHQVAVGVLVGLGVGFISMGLLKVFFGDK